jgi:RNA polymerase sigma factor (sigma-70 family)
VSLPPFEHTVAEHGARVLRVCRALLPLQDAEDAEDAAADALLAALEAYPRLLPGSDVKAWLVTIAHRKALDVLRRKARHAIVVSEVPERTNASTNSGAQGEPVPPDEQLWGAVHALPTKQRQAVAYHYVADLAYAVVAQLMGTSEAAARRSAADGVKALRRVYADVTPEPTDPRATRQETTP